MADHDESSAFETCRIVFWRGYVKCAFYAAPKGGEQFGSPLFRSRERSPLQSGRALEAHQALVERLKAEGWEPVARGSAWYELTFRRRDWSPVEELPTEELPPAVSPAEGHAAPPTPEPQPEPLPALRPEPVQGEPLPALRPEPVQGATAARSRRQLALLLVTAALIALAVAVGVTLFGSTSAQGKDDAASHRPVQRERHQSPRIPHRKPVVSAAPVSRQPAELAPTRIVVTGSRGNSWVEARVGSESGRPLFAGVVAQGQTVRVTAPVVWITFGAAGNLDLRVNGRSPVPGTFDGTITALIAHGRVRST
jgi:hypothetical protein